MKKLIVSLVLFGMLSCSGNVEISNGKIKTTSEETTPTKVELPKRIEIVSSVTNSIIRFDGSYYYVIKDNKTGNEYLVGRATESISIVPIIPCK